MSVCSENHRFDDLFEPLPYDQGGEGRHRCAGCAYKRGLAAGRKRDDHPQLGFGDLPYSQAGSVRHKSPHAAWALGYLHGVKESYQEP